MVINSVMNIFYDFIEILYLIKPNNLKGQTIKRFLFVQNDLKSLRMKQFYFFKKFKSNRN